MLMVNIVNSRAISNFTTGFVAHVLKRVKSIDFDAFKIVLERIDSNLSIKNLNGKDTAKVAIETINEPDISTILNKFSKGRLNITKLVAKRIAYAMSRTNWYAKNPEYRKYMEPKYGSVNKIWYEDLARLMLKEGITSETFYVYLDEYVSKMKEAEALQSSAKSMFGYK